MKRKIYKKHIYLYLVILLFSISCNESEKEIDLGSSFYYIPFQETIFDVTTFGGNGIYEYRNNLKVPVVLPDIENYKYDSDFIIVKQNFNLEQATR